jgi:hypothetical protein
MTDPHAYYQDPPEVIRERFARYRRAGIDMLRIEIGWRLFQPDSADQWTDAGIRPYLEAARDSGLRVKLIVGTIMAPPGWFLLSTPGARLMDENGDMGLNSINLWYEGLGPLLDRVLRRQFEYLRDHDFLGNIDLVVVDLGPAGEPLYPPNWTQGRGAEEPHTFWCYGEGTAASFRVYARERHGTLEACNRAWGTDYGSWSEVELPRPGTSTGAHWEDVLLWYRDSKREFTREQVARFQGTIREFLGDRAQALIYVPGSAIRPSEWELAVRTGDGPVPVKIMADSEFLLDVARETGSVLQYTGAENRREVAYLTRSLRERGMPPAGMWAENSGGFPDPLYLARVLVHYGLRGMDFTHAHHVFAADGITPNHRWPDLEAACRLIRSGGPAELQSPTRAPERQHRGTDGRLERLTLFPEADVRLLAHRESAPILAHAVKAPWQELEATWTERDLGRPWETPGADFGPAPVAISVPVPPVRNSDAVGTEARLDLTAQAQAWLREPSGNHGILLRLPPDTTAAKDFAAREHPDPDLHPRLRLYFAP